jgi:hypothetical protein
MSLLGCNSRLLWHEIYQQLIDIISAKSDKIGIVVCKYFHEIHSELLENFYSYMQKNTQGSINLKFIIITEDIGFIPDNILYCCEIIQVQRPSKTLYNKCIKNTIHSQLKLDTITNIKLLHHTSSDNLLIFHKNICDKIIASIIAIEDIKFLKFRDLLYDIFIYNLNIYQCVWYILASLLQENHIKKKKLSGVLIKTYTFFQYYNNNYRPIYHLENYILYLAGMVHEFSI